MKKKKLEKLLQEVLDDATGDHNDLNRRIYPLRPAMYRKIAKALLKVDLKKEKVRQKCGEK